MLSEPVAPLVRFENGVTLSQFELADLAVKPGHNLPISLFWEVAEQTDLSQELVYELIVVDEAGTVLRRDLNKVGPDWLAVWPLETAVLENSSLYIRPETPTGTYEVQLQLREGDTFLNRRTFNPFQQNSNPITIGQFTVEPWPLVTMMPDFETAVAANFGSFITLSGFDLNQETSSLDLTLYWQTQTQPDDNYTIFIHLVDQNGVIVQQVDQVPISGLRPTGGWRPEEILIDSYQIPIPKGTLSGEYHLQMGLYLPDSFSRLPITVNDTSHQMINLLSIQSLFLRLSFWTYFEIYINISSITIVAG